MSSNATYTHLRNGDWGIRVKGTASVGSSVVVVKKSGETKTEMIQKVLWTGRDSKTGETISLCAIRQHQHNSNSEGEMCAECGERRGHIECRDGHWTYFWRVQ